MRGRLPGLLLASITLSMAGAEPPGMQTSEAIALVCNARQNRTEGYFYRAEAQYRRALAILEQTSGAQSPDLTLALNGLAELYFEARRYTEAEALARRSTAVVEAGLGAGHPLLATALHDLAAIYHAQGQYAKAEPLYYRALAIRETALGPNHPFVAATLANLAGMESAQGNYAGAAEHYARAVRIREDAFGMDDPRVAEALWGYAAVLRKTRQKREAASIEAQSRAILAKAAFR
jgi:tetratricopeptide (TPR) repeat protein